jgi:hypothetical protein
MLFKAGKGIFYDKYNVSSRNTRVETKYKFITRK